MLVGLCVVYCVFLLLSGWVCSDFCVLVFIVVCLRLVVLLRFALLIVLFVVCRACTCCECFGLCYGSLGGLICGLAVWFWVLWFLVLVSGVVCVDLFVIWFDLCFWFVCLL